MKRLQMRRLQQAASSKEKAKINIESGVWNMKKIFVLCICIAILAIILVLSGKDAKVLQKLNVDDLDKIVIYNSDESVTLNQKDDIQKLVDILASMQLRKASATTSDGYAFLIELYDHNEEKITITVASSNITVEGKNYKCQEDYCERIRNVYEQYRIK